jgi:hypothetical protein
MPSFWRRQSRLRCTSMQAGTTGNRQLFTVHMSRTYVNREPAGLLRRASGPRAGVSCPAGPVRLKMPAPAYRRRRPRCRTTRIASQGRAAGMTRSAPAQPTVSARGVTGVVMGQGKVASNGDADGSSTYRPPCRLPRGTQMQRSGPITSTGGGRSRTDDLGIMKPTL